MTAALDAADPHQIIAELRRQLGERTAELAARNSEFGERIEHQSATIDVLKAMSASPGDPQSSPKREPQPPRYTIFRNEQRPLSPGGGNRPS